MNCWFKQCGCFLHPNFNSIRFISTKKLLKDFHLRSYSRNEMFNKRIIPYKYSLIKNYSIDNKHNDKKFRMKKIILIGSTTAAIGVILLGIRYIVTWKSPKILEQTIEDDEKNSRLKIPRYSSDIPKKIPYLLIGGGTASFSAFRAIKSRDPTAKVLIISNEIYFPYMRPPLSKEMWFENNENNFTKLNFKQWNGTERSLFFEPDDFYIAIKDLENERKGGVAVARGWTVTKIDARNKKVILEDGTEIEYDKCLLATGNQSKNTLTFETSSLEIGNKILLFRNIDDFQKLYKIINDGAKSLVIIGNNLLGSELAYALSKNKVKVTQIFSDEGNLWKILPKYLSLWTTENIRSQGVEIISNVDIQTASLSTDKKHIELTVNTKNANNENINTILADYIILVDDSVSNTALADTSNLEIDQNLGGFVVNDELLVHSDLYAAGDCISYYDPLLGRRRFQHHDHAINSGRLAGENMTGAQKSYLHQPMFWSEIGPHIVFEAIGMVDSSLPTVAVYALSNNEADNKNKIESDKTDVNTENKKQHSNIGVTLLKEGEDYTKGVIFYLRNNLIVGILLWNVFNRTTLARQVLKEQKQFQDLNEVAKLFNIHSE